MVNTVDEYAVQQLKEFDGKKVKFTTEETWFRWRRQEGGGDESRV